MTSKATRTTGLFVGLCLAFSAVAKDDPGKDFSIQRFLQACVSSYSQASRVTGLLNLIVEARSGRTRKPRTNAELAKAVAKFKEDGRPA